MMAQEKLPFVLVVMACYNGAEYLDEQLSSILAQQGIRIALLVRDDGSGDSTPEILADWQARYPDQIELLEGQDNNLGAVGSFSLLLSTALRKWQSGCDYAAIALADQDDIWLTNKLKLSLDALMRSAQGKPGDYPLLVHTDLRVVDKKGEKIAASLMQYQGLDAGKRKFSSQLLSNTVTGCTAVCNKALLELALPVPEQAMMHDWWLSLVASAFGEIAYVNEPLIEYRQHGANTLGARKHSKPGWQRLKTLLSGHGASQEAGQAQQLFYQSAEQAKAFRSRFAAQLTAEQKKSLDRAERMPTLGRWQQRILFRWQRWFE
ncbi:glycosyl transferase [Pseudohongiella nitratireducens]|uniref:Glycosyl transferase n=1 Tax=Pseudohongiella nitratireducens TaxID=1768907 RepID=A0A917GLY2_9GAMM|nr:glycosyltransferase family 2 protein [Pseudohongiella nitratireducens]GGG50428.1 glycosyl transferase [Pseudohongiella nitratireducens]